MTFELFAQIINSYAKLPPAEEDHLRTVTHIKSYKAGEHFIRAGERPHSVGVNLHGLFRYYYIDKSGNDFTKNFFGVGAPVSAYSALVQNRESYLYIEALEDSVVAVIHYSDWKKLLARHDCWKLFLIAILEKGYCTKEQREMEFLLLSAGERYMQFRERYPGLENRIKQKYIASYLGITPVALSRTRKKMGLLT